MIEQRFAGVWPIVLRQPTRAQIIAELRKHLERGGEVAPGTTVKATGDPNTFLLRHPRGELSVHFDTQGAQTNPADKHSV